MFVNLLLWGKTSDNHFTMTPNTYSSKYPVYRPKPGHTTFYLLLLNSKTDSQKRVFSIGYSHNPTDPLLGINANSDILWHCENFNTVPELINVGQVKHSNAEEAYCVLIKLYYDEGYLLGKDNSDLAKEEWDFTYRGIPTYKGIREVNAYELERYLETKVKSVSRKAWKERWSPALPREIFKSDAQREEQINTPRTSYPRRGKRSGY